MRSARLFALVLANLRRSRNHFLLASIGIVVGIATFAFFLALGLGVRAVVLGKIFPLDKLEVVPRSLEVDVGPLRMGLGQDALDDAMAAKLGALPGVTAVYPKMKLTVGSIAYGGESLFGADLRSEIVADGIDPALLASEINKDGYQFVDHETPERLAAEPPKACTADAECGDKMYCGEPPGTTTPRRGTRKKPGPDGQPDQPEPAKVCRHFVPVIVSHHVVELYNGTLRRAHGFPQLNPDAVRGFTFDLIIGESMVETSNQDQVIHDRGMFVGFSDKAIPLGITLPLGYVQRYNVRYNGEDAAQRYHSVILEIPVKDDVAAVAKGVEDLDLKVKDSGAEEAALLIAVFMMVFGLVSAVIVGIAAVNIMHVFFMLVYERQREIGVMRAVGASRGDIGRIILGEAASLGTMAGTAGIVLAVTAGTIFDHVSARYVPDFPYKPTTYFDFPWWLIVAALGFSISFCVLGALLPARRAAHMEPARVLSGA
ncbi:ABC transporter permease [Paraliomyxa miuraensis]|uniref:ABC transporter permease n=1 Tax=Paraliomyxa miuraensis TaxID=376150 RepID=UPI0022518275|nr:ABC transporter permease [Paraliomyxa miuraensis]MCX4245045.1 ABC transporter permease [Paraliomyxa miuraensis]